MTTETEIQTAHVMHMGSLKTAEALAKQALDLWCTDQLNGAAATLKAIISWSQQMQTVVPTAPTKDAP
jgi:hypothetical protein